MTRLHGLLLALACVVFSAARVADGADGYDRWYVVEVAGARSGWVHDWSTDGEGGDITSHSETRLEFRRGELAVTVSMRSSFRESGEGDPERLEFEQRFGEIPVRAVYTFGPDGVRVERSQGGVEREERLTLPEPGWLTPAQAAEFFGQRLRSGATEVEFRTIDGSTGLTPVTTTRRGIAPSEVETPGGRERGFRCETTVSNSPGTTSVEWFDARGVLVRMESDLGGMAMVLRASTREEAERSGGGAEVMVSTFVRPGRPIEGARRLAYARYTLRATSGELPDLPMAGWQHVERLDASRARVTVEDGAGGLAGEIDPAEYLRATSALDGTDERVRELADRAVKGAGPGSLERAWALRAYVHRHIKRKDLSVAFATASEVARSGEGDCSEHAMLLAAMLRAQGIPSRVVAGLVYVDQFAGEEGVFGYHMWAQALLGGEGGGGARWVDLDATLGATTDFDAAHIALAASGMGEDEALTGLASITPLLGRLEVEVEESR